MNRQQKRAAAHLLQLSKVDQSKGAHMDILGAYFIEFLDKGYVRKAAHPNVRITELGLTMLKLWGLV